MNKRVLGFAVGALLFFLSQPFLAAPAEKTPRVGVLFIGGKEQPHLELFKQGMRELGYTENKNIIFKYRYAEGKEERLADLAPNS
jgi:hypothetical protein